MIISNKTELIEELIKDIENTAEQVHELLDELNNSKIELAILKNELKTIVENVKDLSQIIRVGNNDGICIISRMALVEHSIKEIKEQLITEIKANISEYKDVSVKAALLEQRVGSILKMFENYNTKQQSKELAGTNGKWQLYVAMASGFLAIIGALLSIVIQHC
jgi:chromosome segregation ATPase